MDAIADMKASVRRIDQLTDGILEAKREACDQRDAYRGALISIGEIIGGGWCDAMIMEDRIREVLHEVGIQYPSASRMTIAQTVEREG